MTATSAALTTGWEADLPVGDTVLRRFVFAYADRLAQRAACVGGRTESWVGARLVDLASPVPFDNAVVLLRPPTAVDLATVTARARSFFPAGRAWVLLSAWPTPDLSALGLRLVGHPPLMLRPAGPWPGPPAQLAVHPVDTPARLRDFERTLGAAYPLPIAAGDLDPGLLDAPVSLFVGYVGSDPVGVAGAAANHGVVEIDPVAVLPQARGRGYGAALTAAAAAIAPDLPAVLLSSDAGRPVYQRLGFLELLRTTMWEVHP